MIKIGHKGFLVLDVLIAGVILASCIAATMYLFRIGFESLERVNRMNLISEKALHSASQLKTVISEHPSGEENVGDGVILRWNSTLIGKSQRRKQGTDIETITVPLHELMLYRVDYSLNYQGYEKSYYGHIFKFRPLYEPDSGKFEKL